MIVDIFDEQHLRCAIASACKKSDKILFNKATIVEIRAKHRKGAKKWKSVFDDNGDLMLLKDKGDLKVFITYLQAHMTKNVFKEIDNNKCSLLDEQIEKYDLK